MFVFGFFFIAFGLFNKDEKERDDKPSPAMLKDEHMVVVVV